MVGLYGCNLLDFDLPTDQFPSKTITSVQMVGGQGGEPGYVSKCGTDNMVFATSIKIYTDQETHANSNFIDQVTVYWSDGTNNRRVFIILFHAFRLFKVINYYS